MDLIKCRRDFLGPKPVKITWDAASHDKYIGANGVIGDSSNFHYSDLLPVITGTCKYCFTFQNTINDRNTRIHGYDSMGQWVKQLAYEKTHNGIYAMDFTVSSDVKYIRISNGTQATKESIYQIK